MANDQQKNRQQLIEVRNARLATAEAAIKNSAMTLAAHNVDPDKFGMVIREALLANPDIVKAEERSFARAIRKCCRDGIIPDGDRGALVIFAGEAVAMPMVQGILQMASEDLNAEIRSGVVHEGDMIRVIEGVGVDPQIRIESEGTEIFLSRKGENVIGAWCWIKLPFEKTARLVLFSQDEIRRARAASKAQSGPWKTWPERMAEKACVKSAIWRLRYLAHVQNQGSRLLRVVEDDNQAEYGTAHVDDVLYGDGATVIEGEVVEVEDRNPPAEEVKDPAKPRQRRRQAAPAGDQPAAGSAGRAATAGKADTALDPAKNPPADAMPDIPDGMRRAPQETSAASLAATLDEAEDRQEAEGRPAEHGDPDGSGEDGFLPLGDPGSAFADDPTHL